MSSSDQPGRDSSASSDARVDELRQRLRALGYLDAGVDRFVLGPARASRRPWTIALYSSLRVGVLAALLLGPAAAIGVSARVPGLVAGSRDAIVVAVYLGVFFGLAIAAAAFVAGLAVSLAARQSGPAFAPHGSAAFESRGRVRHARVPRLLHALVADGRRARRVVGAVLDDLGARDRRGGQPPPRPCGDGHVLRGERCARGCPR